MAAAKHDSSQNGRMFGLQSNTSSSIDFEMQGVNPIFGTENIIDTSDSVEGSRNPLFDSTSGQPIADEHTQRNTLFGTDILDSLQETRWLPLLPSVEPGSCDFRDALN